MIWRSDRAKPTHFFEPGAYHWYTTKLFSASLLLREEDLGKEGGPQQLALADKLRERANFVSRQLEHQYDALKSGIRFWTWWGEAVPLPTIRAGDNSTGGGGVHDWTLIGSVLASTSESLLEVGGGNVTILKFKYDPLNTADVNGEKS